MTRYKRPNPTKLGGAIHKKLRDEFGDLPVVDGCIPVRLQPMPCDVAGAVQKDPTNCVYARAARRQYGATKVIFWKTCAYIDLVGRDGVRRVERFIIAKDMLELIEKFDRGEPFEEGHAFQLLIPGPNHTIKVRREYNRKRQKKPVTRILVKARTLKTSLLKKTAVLEKAEQRLQVIRATEKPRSAKVRLAAERVSDAKVRLKETAAKAEKVFAKAAELRPGFGGWATRTFDLSVRNGQAHYNIRPAP